ncbi:MAG: M43 family zinc metalloprotease [Bacteroidota bacterium]
MSKKYKLKIVLSFLVCVFGIFFYIKSIAQNIKRCGTTEMTQKLIDENPHLLPEILKTRQELEEHTQNFISNKNLNSASTIYVIPVIFHIIHNNGNENIPDARVFEAMKILNDDFGKWNSDTDEVVSPFNSIIGNANIEFRLARIDPWGNPTNGIQRIVSTETYVGDSDSKLSPWPRSKYLNIWVCAAAGGAAAYALLPADAQNSAAKDGIMIMASHVGNDDRTLTHETGHWINLLHPWGWSNDPGLASNCSMDDGVSDTPNTIGVDDWSCDTNQVTCTSLDNVQNFMDYSICERMFTEGQVSRMRACLNSSIAQRNNLWTAYNLTVTGVDNSAITFSADITHICTGLPVNFIDRSYNAITSWEWSFPGGTPSASTMKYPAVTYDLPGIYDVSLTVTNDDGSYSETKSSYISVTAPLSMPYSEAFSTGLDWAIVNGDYGNTWEYTSFASYSGSGGSLKMNNYSGNMVYEKDEGISPPIDLSVMESAQITFKVAYAQKSATTNDVLKLWVSPDCGNIWTTIWVKAGSNLAGPNGIQATAFIPADTSDWQEFSNNIPIYLTQDFRFKFEFICYEGNNLYIDNITINGVFNTIPMLISPQNYSTGQTVNVTLDWNTVAGADFYQYEADTAFSFSSPVLKSNIVTLTEYQVTGLEDNAIYFWRVRSITGQDTSDWSSIWRFTIVPAVEIDNDLSSNLNLMIYPNPVKDFLVISFNLDKPAQHVSIKIYDVLGREVLSVSDPENQVLDAGNQRFILNFQDEDPGIYLIRLLINDQVFTNKFIISNQ